MTTLAKDMSTLPQDTQIATLSVMMTPLRALTGAILRHAIVVLVIANRRAFEDEAGLRRIGHRSISQIAPIAARVEPTPISAANINGLIKLGPRPLRSNGCSSSLIRRGVIFG